MKTIVFFVFFFACLTARAADTDERIEVVLNGGLMASVRNTTFEGKPIAACHFVELQYLNGLSVEVTEAYSFRKGYKLYLPLSVVSEPCDREKVAEWFEVENELLQHPVRERSFELQAARMKARQGEQVARVIPPPLPITETPPPPKRVSLVYGPSAPKPMVAKAPTAPAAPSVPAPIEDFRRLSLTGEVYAPSEGFSTTQVVVEQPRDTSKSHEEAPKPPRFPWVWVGVFSLAVMVTAGFFAARICRVEKLDLGTKVPRNIIIMKQAPPLSPAPAQQTMPVAVATSTATGSAVLSSAPAFQPVMLSNEEKFVLLYRDLESWYKNSSIGQKVSGITFLNKSDGPRLVVHCSGDSDNVKLAIFKRIHHKHAGLMVTYRVAQNHLGSDIILKIA